MILPLVGAIAVAVWLGHWAYGLAAGVVLYFGSCLVHPEADCLHCRGKAKRRSEGGSVFHRCYVCKGSGARRRVGTIMLRSVGLGGPRDE